MVEWITTDEALAIGKEQFRQTYHIEYLRQLLRDGKVESRKFGRSWQINKKSWFDYLKQAEESDDKRRGGRTTESDS